MGGVCLCHAIGKGAEGQRQQPQLVAGVVGPSLNEMRFPSFHDTESHFLAERLHMRIQRDGSLRPYSFWSYFSRRQLGALRKSMSRRF